MWRASQKLELLPVSTATEYRVGGIVLGCVFLLVIPGALLGPVIFGGLALAAIPGWAPVVSTVSAALGLWHLITAAFALDEDLEFITGYFVAQEAVPLMLPFVLFVGTRSVYRRLFAPAFVARRRWQARRDERVRREPQASRSASSANEFPDTMPREP